ncbi:hypothetical protein Cni_G05345 [Canna indica]|uniref:NAC domain-containing protein n=1 Tax=Canna indica TaxID=4628 RepID=A0AAQ3Q3N4_9LILI|nr:hypothetical protein Cni_G05345 [Canna indica]
MDSSSFVNVKHGALRLPPGFRFHPTDEELVVQYLRRKALSCPLPAAVIPEVNLGKFDPWDLPGDSEGARYFFSLRETGRPNGRHSRATRTGYWKATGKAKPVVAAASNELVGMKRVLVFHRGKPPRGCRTDWVMHEYCLAAACNSMAFCFAHRKDSMHSKDWVVCRIFRKRAEAGSRSSYNEAQFQLNHSELVGSRTSNSTTSSSSCLTCLSEEEGDEVSSSFTST